MSIKEKEVNNRGDIMKKLYKEILDGKVVSIERHKLPIHASELKRASKKEISEAKKYFNEHGLCNGYHLIYDEPGSIYNSRYCKICGKFIGFI